ncbi:MAG: hypothetical protein LC808_06905, partial [Actinobacteria bacterium]|nr:hypothetical protein [Actinomycetota bacterium]
VLEHASTRLNLIVDSGTTMATLFPQFLDFDWQWGEPGFNYEIHTNNLAGIELLNLVSGSRASPVLFSDEGVTLNLIGGHPYRTYRATLGEPTQQYLEGLRRARDEQRKTGAKFDPIIGIVTGNWILGGRDLTSLAICARGRSHLEFKRAVVEMSDQIIVVSPLGKILALADVDDLNRIAKDSDHPQDRYESIALPADKESNPILVTTYRSEGSASPLLMTSLRLQEIGATNVGVNYQLYERNPVWEPNGDPQHIREVDLPHRYMRKHARDAYSPTLT